MREAIGCLEHIVNGELKIDINLAEIILQRVHQRLHNEYLLYFTRVDSRHIYANIDFFSFAIRVEILAFDFKGWAELVRVAEQAVEFFIWAESVGFGWGVQHDQKLVHVANVPLIVNDLVHYHEVMRRHDQDERKNESHSHKEIGDERLAW